MSHVVSPRAPSDVLRAAFGGDQITRLRRGCFGLVLMFCFTGTMSVVTTPRAASQVTYFMLTIVALGVSIVVGYKRRAFTLPLRVLIVALLLVLAPLLGNVIVGAAYTTTWLLALYRGVNPVLTAVGAGVAIVIGEMEAAGATALDVGNVVGETVSLCMMALFLGQLRVSLGERDVLQRTLTRQAHYDSLTDLPNRRSFHQALELAVERYRHLGEPYAILMLDLDDFKRINDTYGHGQGDRVLLAVAKRIAECIRASDHCARLGGDEFAVLITDCRDREVARELTERLEREVRLPVDLDDSVEVVGVSIGVTWSGETADAALRNADHAMYATKIHRKTSATTG